MKDKNTYLQKTISIHRTSFTAAPDCRDAMLNEVKALYSKYMSAPDGQKILDFVGEFLSAELEELDVFHDILAYLSE